MSGSGVYLGIDTSNYTTSVAIISEDGSLLGNIKRPLTVKAGERGLRQSDAVFAHIKNIPCAMEEATEVLHGRCIRAVGVSERPRNIDGSYMPCFLAGVASAQSISSALDIPLYRFSHQCGHIMAALYSSSKLSLRDDRFGAFHISGGTTELLCVSGAEHGFRAEIVGGTKDLNAGQVIDRIGVHLGLPFPAGVHLERLAMEYNGKVMKRRPAMDGTYVNLSGVENIALKLFEQTADRAAVASFVLDHIGDAVLAMSEAYREKYGDMPLVFAGGVMSNSLIKQKLSLGLKDCYFAQPQLSADNAVGVAVLTMLEHMDKTEE